MSLNKFETVEFEGKRLAEVIRKNIKVDKQFNFFLAPDDMASCFLCNPQSLCWQSLY